MPSNDSTRVLEGFLAALLKHHGGGTTTSCVDTSSGTMMDHPTTISGGDRPMMKVNLIMDNCAIHQTKHSAVRKTFSGCSLRTTSFERPTSVLKEDERLLPPPRRYLSCRSGEKRDTSPMMPRSDNHKIRFRIEEQDDSIEIPKQSLHQSCWTTRRLAPSTIITSHDRSTSCASSSEEGSAVLAAADHCNSRWWSSCPMTRNANSQRPFSVELVGVHKKFPSPPHPAKRQVSIENEEEEKCGAQQELATTTPSSSRQVVVISDQAEDEESSIMMQEEQHASKNSSLPNKDCKTVMALVDQALHAMANSFPDAVYYSTGTSTGAGPRDRKTPYHVMPCHHRSHSLVAPPVTRSGTKA